ncbi:carbohydrate ABC transporter permease [Capillibacterium thermochitinicola]|uniref:Sugar ABC transporter permease n=1 Tax=Capillibacterium thermochitinicola TaxID=2699427 RepID=A0A8J6I2D1_9FIRM|nr:sugar ABC transporter permease [Capillibacterium thermochitinicola]MBA2133434.1 sugar ABC transporter permease [Capillibacterium thermochitinicola]
MTELTMKNRLRRCYNRMIPYFFVSPFFAFFLVFGAFPIFFALYLSFHSWNGIATSPMVYIGWENYTYTLTDPMFWQALKNTVVMAIVSGVPQHILGLFFAFILNLGFVRLKNFFKATLFLPYITSTVAVSMVFAIFYGYPFGFANYLAVSLDKIPFFHAIFSLFNLEIPLKWLASPPLMIPTISTQIIWRWTGWNTILYLAGLQTIPQELYEAARVDGAKWHQVFFKITLPSLRPVMQFAITMSVIGGLQIFNEPFIMVGKNGGTGRAAYTLAMYLYQTGFEWGYFGGAAAISYIVFVLIFIASMISRRVLRSDEGVS